VRRKHRKRMTKEDVNMILVLSEGKRPIRNIAEAVGRSVGTVCAVRKTGSFSAYKSMIHERNMKIKRPRKETPQPSVKGQEDVVIAINRLTVAVESLVEAWNSPTKRKFF